jgi:ribosomal protein RSM22 (predicted rRNA methylase)
MKTLAANVARLSRLLTLGRENLPPAYLKDAGLREAYVSYFLPSNVRKILLPLQELSLHPSNMHSKAKLRILDMGCGPGTAILGVMEFFSQRETAPLLEFTAVDLVPENLKEAEKLFTACRNATRLNATLKTIHSSIEDMKNPTDNFFDIILLSNVLNELFPQDEVRIKKRAGLLHNLLNHLLDANGSCIIIEPALRETSRDMLEVRDAILEQGLRVYSPCFYNGKCPALVNPKDWCHEDIAWDPPRLIQEIDKLTGLRKDSLKFSYLVLGKKPISLSDVCGSHAFRIVSEPLVSKGKIEFFACGPDGRRLITRLDKDKASVNQAFEKMHRGSVVRFEQLIDEGKRYKVGKDTVVQDVFTEKRSL